MNRQLRAGGGIMDIAPREKFGLGSSFKKFVRKVIPNEVSKVAVKAAPFVAPFNPLLAAGMAGIGGFDQTGSIGKSLRNAALTYGGGQLARYAGGAGFQEGINPFQGADFSGGLMSGIKSLGSSPIGVDTGLKLGQYEMFGAPKAVPEGQFLPSDFATQSLPLEQATTGLTQTGGEVAKQTTGNLLKSIVNPESTLAERSTALKDLGGKALKAIYTKPVPGSPGQTQIDKMAIGATIAGAASYAEAAKLAKEAELVDDVDEYTEDMYEADKSRYTDYYSEILTPEAFGLKDGGRIGYKFGSPEMPSKEGITSITLSETDDDNNEEAMMMADAPGITFTSGEKSFLFKTLAGQGGSDRSFTMPQLYGVLNNPNSSKNIEDAKALKAFLKMKGFKKGGRVEFAMGSPEQNAKEASGISGIPLNVNPAGATELDMRETGGFVPPVGVKEKADDIPAMLSNNEFVFTADAVRAAGGGSVNKGAKRMYDMMKSLEGKVV